MAVFSLQKELSGPLDWENDYANLEAVSKVPFTDVKQENKNAVRCSILKFIWILTIAGLSQRP